MSVPLTTSPDFPSTTASGAPPEEPASTGSPHALASKYAIPKPSTSHPQKRDRDGIAKRSPTQMYSGNFS